MGIKDVVGRARENKPDTEPPQEAAEAKSAPAASVAEEDTRPQAVYSPDEDAPMRPIYQDAEEEGEGAAKTAKEAEEEEESKEKEEEKVSRRKLPGFSNAQELLANELPARATYADSKLRSNLVGSIVVHLRDSDERFLFDWTTEELHTGRTDLSSADCMIHLTSQNLLKIAQGDLNPQIGMLSDKVSVEGRAGLAIYFFNLVAPRVQH